MNDNMPKNTGQKPVVLIGEDEEGVRKLLKIALEERGFEVMLAANGREAAALYGQHKSEIDLVLLDVQMPEMDGPHALAAMRKLNPAVRCCLMTASSGPYTYQELHQLDADRIFEKPFPSLQELASVMHMLAAESQCR